MFQGAAALNLDAKGRLAVPSRHREGLSAATDGTLVLTAHPHRCLLIYPLPAWEPIRDKVLAAPSLEQQSAYLKRLLVGFAREEEMDAAGRLLIAPELRQYAGLEKEVWLVGRATISSSGRTPAGSSSRKRYLPSATSCCRRDWRRSRCE